MEKREADGKTIQIIVGMGTCGIAAGAKDTVDAFITSLDKHSLSGSVVVRQSGCMGLCSHEPTVEIIAPGMETVMYGDIKAPLANRLVESHVVNKTPVPELIVGQRKSAV
jgi:NADP-reducing hydrogenase subunit HndB